MTYHPGDEPCGRRRLPPHGHAPLVARGLLARCLATATIGVVAGCGSFGDRGRPQPVLPSIEAVLAEASASPSVPPQPSPATGRSGRTGAAERDTAEREPPPPRPQPASPPETRFDLTVTDAPIQQVLSSIVHGTRYSMIVHPEVQGSVTLRLKRTTLTEALDSIREVYGWEWRNEGTRIFVTPEALQSRIYRINLPTSSRSGRTDIRVTSGSIANPLLPPGTSASATGQGTTGNAAPQESMRVTTQHRSDLWSEVESTLKLMVGDKNGRQVVISSQTGVIVVRAMPAELRSVEHYLRETRISIERQVMLEAKIVEVSLRDQFQSGVNWSQFRPGTGATSSRMSAGVLAPGSTLGVDGTLGTPLLSSQPGASATLAATAPGGLIGLAFQTGNFAAMLSFLESQGRVQVLSSPRIATMNNQKAVLKVGTDDFFVTNVSTTTVTSGTGNTTSPSITVQPFFSGIALDVTPQIDDGGNVILHVHPQVSQVEERRKQLNLGSLGAFTLPLASSSVRETDAVVRVPDGNIVAIGGLMRHDARSDRSQVPGTESAPFGLGWLLGQRDTASSKQELVILLKPTVIQDGRGWEAGTDGAGGRIRESLKP